MNESNVPTKKKYSVEKQTSYLHVKTFEFYHVEKYVQWSWGRSSPAFHLLSWCFAVTSALSKNSTICAVLKKKKSLAEIYAFCIEKNLANNLAVNKNTIILPVEKNTNMRYVEQVQLGPIYFLLLLFYGELYQQQHRFGPKFIIKNMYIEWLGLLKHSKFLSNLMINLS